eukprot:3950180-Amphidinium_carterae.1
MEITTFGYEDMSGNLNAAMDLGAIVVGVSCPSPFVNPCRRHGPHVLAPILETWDYHEAHGHK